MSEKSKVCFTGDTNYWFEASPVEDVLVCENRFVGARGTVSSTPEYESSEAAPYYHSGIRVENNVFDMPRAMYARLTDRIVFRENRCSDPAEIPVLQTADCGEVVSD